MVVILQRRETPPGRIVAAQLDIAGKKVEPEDQPAIEPCDGSQTCGGAPEEDGQKPGFQQQRVPLEREKFLASQAEGQVENEQQRQR